MSKVFFSKELDEIIDQIDFSGLGQKVGVKVHFGEKGCDTFINPETVRKIYEKIKSLGKEPVLVETNVLYVGSRTNKADHIKTAREHGFTEMEIDILDGEKGEEYIEIDGCKIGKGVKKYDSLIVLSHFKGHIATGFGGAIKNMGMGFGSRAGKLDMHSGVKPVVSEKCTGCGMCVDSCNARAISIVDGKAQIDEGLCEGCAMCIAACPSGGMQIPFGTRGAEGLQKRMAEYAKAAGSFFPSVVYVNFMENITEHCDCAGFQQDPFMKDVGVLYSKDMAAIDKASLDLANEASEGKFNEINEVDGNIQIEEIENLGAGVRDYSLVEL